MTGRLNTVKTANNGRDGRYKLLKTAVRDALLAGHDINGSLAKAIKDIKSTGEDNQALILS